MNNNHRFFCIACSIAILLTLQSQYAYTDGPLISKRSPNLSIEKKSIPSQQANANKKQTTAKK